MGPELNIVVQAKASLPAQQETVGGNFLYDLTPGSGTLHNEIDFGVCLSRHPVSWPRPSSNRWEVPPLPTRRFHAPG